MPSSENSSNPSKHTSLPQQSSQSSHISPSSQPPRIQLQDIHLQVRSKNETRTLFKGFNLTVNEGEVVAILGAAGTGKSSLLNLILGAETPTLGKVLVDGINLAELTKTQMSVLRHSRFAVLSSESKLLAGTTPFQTIQQALKFRSAESNCHASAESLMQLTDVLKFRDTPVNRLSDEVRYRVILTKALAGCQSLILTDDICDSLTQQSAQSFINLLTDLSASGRAIVYTTTREHLAAHVSKIVRLP